MQEKLEKNNTWKFWALQKFRFDFKKAPASLLVHALKQHNFCDKLIFSRQIYKSIAYLLTAWSF